MSKILLMSAAAALACVAAPAHAQAITPDEASVMRAQIDALRAQVTALEARLNAAAPVAAPMTEPIAPPVAVAAPTAAATVAPVLETSWRGAPEFSSAGGWSFKPRGRVHFDGGNISTPGALATTRNLGTNVRLRRVRLGAEGTISGGFGYKVEVDFANAGTSFGDTFMSYDFARNAQLRVGNFETLNGLEQISSSNYVTFMERAAFNDAFGNSRRLGAAVAWTNHDVRAEAGLFAAHSIDGSFDNDGYIAAGRLTYSPEALGGRLHLGASVQFREFATNAGGAPSSGANQPSVGQLARYRARPNTQLTDVRFVDTGSFAARGDTIIGIEAAAIFKGLYVTGEAQWNHVRAYQTGDRLAALDGFGGTNSAVVPTSDPSFFGVYAEVGYFLTGEARAMRGGLWQRTRVRNPVSRGGPGAWSVAARIDHVDLNDAALQAGPTNDFTTGGTTFSAINSRLARGGSQTGLLFGVNWQPVDYVRFMLNYDHVMVEGGPLAALVNLASSLPVNERDYSVNVVAARMQVDF